MTSPTTICAQATPLGNGGVGIVRLSGPQALVIGQQMTQHPGTPRYAHYGPFFNQHKEELDQGISLYFLGPNSFTGEDVFELQGHGGQLIIDMLIVAATQLGAELASPGEFSQRAFINDKMDLAQAESIADLINASSQQAARNALRSLQGDFSRHVDALVEQLIYLRLYVEASIDFPEEEVDFLTDGKVTKLLENTQQQLDTTIRKAQQGRLLQEGVKVVIAGAPNVGKSSLLNALSGQDRAIVTDIPGTTRDTLFDSITIDGLPVHIIDTAGLRDSSDKVEKIGIKRTLTAINQADHILLLQNCINPIDPRTLWKKLIVNQPLPSKLTLVCNKIDLHERAPSKGTIAQIPVIYLSAKHQIGIDLLRDHLKLCVGYDTTLEGEFSARRRHLDALIRAQSYLINGAQQLHYNAAGELLAEDLRLAQDCLSEITGQFTNDDLLDKIFGSFCIGK